MNFHFIDCARQDSNKFIAANARQGIDIAQGLAQDHAPGAALLAGQHVGAVLLQPLRCLHKYEVGTATGVCCLAFHPRNHLLTVTYDKGETVGWIKETRVPLSIQLAGSVRGVAHAAHGGIVAATSAGVTMYHPTKGAKMLQLSAQRCSSLCYVEEAGVAGGRLAFAEDADVLVCSGDALQDAPYDVAVRMGK